MARPITLPRDFHEFVGSLLARDARFLVVGGHAVSVQAAPRFTDDFDVMTRLSGVDFEACYPLRVEVELDGLAVPFIGVECLRTNKRASGRN